MNKIEIQELTLPALLPYAALSEKQLYHYHEPKPGVFVAESLNVILRALHAGYQPESFLIEHSQLKGAVREMLTQYPDVPVYVGETAVLKQITGYEMTRGVLALLGRKPTKELPDLSALHRIVVLEEVMNPTNIGAIFRSAAALGAEAVLLTKGCSDPLYRRAARVSMGTVFQLPWSYVGSNWAEELRAAGWITVAMALRNDTKELDDPLFRRTERLAVVLGTEGEGLRNETIAACDYTVKIPMANGVDSLNVAAASAVALWELCGKAAR